MVEIKDEVGERLSSNLKFKLLKDIEGYYSKQYGIDLSVNVALRFRTPQDYNGKSNPTLGDIFGKKIDIIFKEKQRYPYTEEFIDWVTAHEFRHRMQALIPSLKKEIAKEVKYLRKKFPPRDFPDVNWHVEVTENDANFFASETTGYTRPVKFYKR